MTTGAVAGSAAVPAARIAAGFSAVSAPAGIAASAGAIAAAATVVTATSTGSPTAMVAATTAISTAPATSTTSFTVSQRGLGVQRLVVKQRKWRGGQCRASKQCKNEMTDGAKVYHDASSWLVQSRYR
jgi:hypothetical protein